MVYYFKHGLTILSPQSSNDPSFPLIDRKALFDVIKETCLAGFL